MGSFSAVLFVSLKMQDMMPVRTMESVNFIGAVTERDIDLLILEEFHCSEGFRDWIVDVTGISQTNNLDFIDAWHSIVDARLGESDLIAMYSCNNQARIALLIENKINASPQPGQAQRYFKRGQKGIDRGYWDRFSTCLIAPNRYLESTTEAAIYEYRISYESIQEALKAASTDPNRSNYKIRLLGEAIELNRRGYQPVPHEKVTAFWHHYWDLVRSEFPELDMKRPASVPMKSDWPIFRVSGIKNVRRILHKWKQGYVDLELSELDSDSESRLSRYVACPASSLKYINTRRARTLRIVVPVVDRLSSFKSQIPSVRQGLMAIRWLLEITKER